MCKHQFCEAHNISQGLTLFIVIANANCKGNWVCRMSKGKFAVEDGERGIRDMKTMLPACLSASILHSTSLWLMQATRTWVPLHYSLDRLRFGEEWPVPRFEFKLTQRKVWNVKVFRWICLCISMIYCFIRTVQSKNFASHGSEQLLIEIINSCRQKCTFCQMLRGR